MPRAHRIRREFRVSMNKNMETLSFYPAILTDPLGEVIETEAGEDITMDGQSGSIILLPSHRIGLNTFRVRSQST